VSHGHVHTGHVNAVGGNQSVSAGVNGATQAASHGGMRHQPQNQPAHQPQMVPQGNVVHHHRAVHNPLTVTQPTSTHQVFRLQPGIMQNPSPQTFNQQAISTNHHHRNFDNGVRIDTTSQHVNHQNRVDHQPHHAGLHHHAGTQQPAAGNTLNFGHRHIHLANAGYQPSYQRHTGQYHGHWNVNRGSNNVYISGGSGYGNGNGWGLGYSSGGFGYSPYYWGMGGWGLGSLSYGSGYLSYSNPYYLGYRYTGPGYNYSQPIPVAYNTQAVAVNPLADNSGQSDLIFDAAVAAFKQNDLNTALDVVTQGIQQYPDDAVLHEFSALVLFAKGNYQRAAATMHSVLAVGPGWDWQTMSGFYSDLNLYTLQLRALESAVKQEPQDSAQRFLLAYHYLSDGYPDAAARQLAKVVELVPTDVVAADLLKMVTAAQSANGNVPAAQPTPQPPSVEMAVPGNPALASPAASVDAAAVVGQWNAARDDGSTFSLSLSADKTFTWSFTPKGQQTQAFDGTYTLQGNVIALERTGGGSLMAEIRSLTDASFNFKMVGSPNQDPGLDFAR